MLPHPDKNIHVPPPSE